ncbi:MAG TPA: enoyl-CoA hydratase/isomerase family protein, partial [Rhodopila sp.]|uniref:enoyl-CoA hydratase/isomerase family protein n=1 Tax=Rhodopila sp. TaxID=2480087 RepID=UPI002C263CA4
LSALAAFNEALPASPLTERRAGIDHCFSATTVPEIVARLQATDGDWAREALDALNHVSPSALFWTLKALRRGRDLTLKDALDAEFALTKTTMAHPDFVEGVRAMVVDKDRKPNWQPASIDAVDPASIDALF